MNKLASTPDVNLEYELAKQDYILTRQDLQGIVSRLGQALTVVIGAFALFSVIGSTDDAEVRAISATVISYAIDFALLMMVWLAYKQMQLFNHAKALVDYFKAELKRARNKRVRKYLRELILRYDRESPLVKAYSLKKGQYVPYTIIVVLATVMVGGLLLAAGLVSIRYILEISQNHALWLPIFVLSHFSMCITLLVLWLLVILHFDGFMKTKLEAHKTIDQIASPGNSS